MVGPSRPRLRHPKELDNVSDDMQVNNMQEAKAHEVTILVNGRPKKVEKGELTYDEVLVLAFDPVPSGPNWVFTVNYRGGHGRRGEGSLTPGESVEVVDGMIFDVTATDKS
jgi:hypothetical protein